MPTLSLNVATSIAALAAVLGLIVLAGRLLRGAGLPALRSNVRLQAREALALDRTRSLRIVSCDGRDLLILIGGASDVVVGWLPHGDRA